MGISSKMKGIYGRRRLVEERDKPKKCKRNGRGI